MTAELAKTVLEQRETKLAVTSDEDRENGDAANHRIADSAFTIRSAQARSSVASNNASNVVQ